MTEAKCPSCEKVVEIESPWGDFACPLCGRKGYWTEDYDGVDEWAVPEWE